MNRISIMHDEIFEILEDLALAIGVYRFPSSFSPRFSLVESKCLSGFLPAFAGVGV